MAVYLAVEANDRGWVTTYRYNAKTTEWDGIRKNYTPWNFRGQFLRDVENWYGKNAVPAYRAALDNAPFFGKTGYPGWGRRVRLNGIL